MFYYFGRKARLAPRYAEPAHDLVIEPFAGSMAYTLHHRPAQALGVEINLAVVDVWQRIAAMAPDDIAAFPNPEIGTRVTDRWQMFAAGSHGTTRATSYLWTERMQRDFAKQRKMAAAAAPYVQESVEYRHGDYRDAPDVEATWFIDPPYQNVRRGYERDAIDYAELGEWCRSRRGLVIVCEQWGADWLPFRPLAAIRGTTNRQTVEMVWTSVNEAEEAAA